MRSTDTSYLLDEIYSRMSMRPAPRFLEEGPDPTLTLTRTIELDTTRRLYRAHPFHERVELARTVCLSVPPWTTDLGTVVVAERDREHGTELCVSAERLQYSVIPLSFLDHPRLKPLDRIVLYLLVGLYNGVLQLFHLENLEVRVQCSVPFSTLTFIVRMKRGGSTDWGKLVHSVSEYVLVDFSEAPGRKGFDNARLILRQQLVYIGRFIQESVKEELKES